MLDLPLPEGRPARALLIVEDPALSARLRDLLAGRGISGRGLGRGEATFDRVIDEQPDLVLLGEGPLELCRRIKTDPMTHLVPVIVLADGAGAASRVDAIAAGADHWLGMPLDAEELLARAAALLAGRKLTRAIQASRETLRLRRDWLRFLLHDLRTPLTAAVTNLDFAASCEEPAEAAPALRDARVGLARMAKTIQDLHDTDRLQHGELSPSMTLGDLPLLVEEWIAALRADGEADGRRITVRSSGLSPLRFDHELLGRAVTHLLINALRYGPPGEPIEVDLLDGPGGGATLRITNRGPAIPPKDRERIFEPFVRHDPTSTAPHGTGLGLALCRLVVRAHGGRIYVESAVGPVTFVVELPAGRARDRATAPPRVTAADRTTPG